MNSDFSRIMTLLRKERGLSQKQAAMELGVSQALLSHYEKGIRECGLDFVVRIADYYDVSCDYLLGRSADRKGATLDIAEPAAKPSNESADTRKTTALIALNKKLISNSLNVIFSVLEEADNKGLASEVSSYIMVSIYKMLRAVYSANPDISSAPQLSPDIISKKYPELAPALYNLIRETEEKIKKLT